MCKTIEIYLQMSNIFPPCDVTGLPNEENGIMTEDNLKINRSSHGPLPKGSRVLLRLTIEKSLYPFENDSVLTVDKSGLAMLPVRLEVASGAYAGCFWFERITVPVHFQNISLTDVQKEACRIGGKILHQILLSSHGGNSSFESDTDELESITSWQIFSGLLFPAKLGIDPVLRVSRNGQAAWRNCLKYVLPVTDSDYSFIMNGGEYISKGAVDCNNQSREEEKSNE